jgi:RHS repeat-associated protein
MQTSYTVEPFGNTTVTGSSTTNSFAFTGRELDSTGLYFYRARYYSPTLQRFVSEDPVGFAGGNANLYGYVDNSPTNADDPLGLWSPAAHDKILDHALSGCATPSDIKAIQDASKDFDRRTGGGRGFSPVHSMRARWETPQQALAIRDGFTQQTISQASDAQQAGIHGQAMALLGEAVHPTMDSTSLLHVDSNGNPLLWDAVWGNFWNDVFHSPWDFWGAETSNMLAFGSPRFDNMDDQIRSAYKRVMGGCTAGRKN